MIEKETRRDFVGIIYPPPEIRKVVDTTAQFVSKNGKLFENRIKEIEKGNPKFSFLHLNDPYHQYYVHQIQLNIQSNDNDNPFEMDQEEAKVNADEYVASVKEKAKAKKEVEPMIEPERAPDFQFLYDLPAVTAEDLDVIKLTALFMARNGRQFINTLSSRETKNSQFDFLRPGHPLFPLFTKFVECYTAVLIPNDEFLNRLKIFGDKFEAKKSIDIRVDHALYEEEERKRNNEKEDKDRIDWHDFVVVQTLEYSQQDESVEFQQPITQVMLENWASTQKKMQGIISGPQIPSTIKKAEPVLDIKKEKEKAIELKIDEEEKKADVKENKPKEYKPKIKSRILGQTGSQLCPNCNQMIPINEMEEHMRIELLDPKWKKQKEIAEKKLKDSNIITEGTDIAMNLKKISGKRSDIFGNNDLSKNQLEENKPKPNKLIWDGSVGGISAINRMNQEMANKALEASELKNNQAYNRTSGPFSNQGNGNSDPSQHYPGYDPNYVPLMVNSENPPPAIEPSQHTAPIINSFEEPEPIYTRPPIVINRSGVPEQGYGFSVPAPPKKPKLDLHPNFVEETYWLSMKPDQSPITINIDCVDYPLKPEWNLKGQTVQLSDLDYSISIEQVKQLIEKQLGVPVPKQKLSVNPKVMTSNSALIVTKNFCSLAYYNVENLDSLSLTVKERGGRK